MTVSSTVNRIAYTGNGATTLFSFPYPFIASSDIQVYVAGVLKALTTDYTVSGTAPYPTGANITFVSAPANLASIVIIRVRPYTQTLDLVENDPLPAEQVELDFDHLVMLAQQLNEAIGRALVIPATDVTGTTVTLPAAATRANQALLFDASGNVTVGSGTSTSISAAMVPVVQAVTLALARAAFGATAIGESLFTAASAAAARSAISAQISGSYAASGANTDITSLASPALASATATTQAIADNSTKVATTAFLKALFSPITASLGADVAMGSSGTYFDGPSIAQGTSGTWYVSGTVTVVSTSASASFTAKLHDGATVIASAVGVTVGANNQLPISLSGYLANPAGNLRISVSNSTNTTGKILFNASALSKDSTISAMRLA